MGSQCGPPDWHKFQEWLWNISEVQDMIQTNQNAKGPRLAIVSHGNFLTQLLEQAAWKGGHLHNVEMVSAVMPFDNKGFGDFHSLETVGAGFDGDPTKVYWGIICVACLCIIACLVWCCVKKACRKTPLNEPILLETAS